MDLISMGLILIALVVIIGLLILLYRLQYKKVGPNEILIISGGRRHMIEMADGSMKEVGFRFRIGGGTFVNPLTERAEKLTIEVIPVRLKSPEVIA